MNLEKSLGRPGRLRFAVFIALSFAIVSPNNMAQTNVPAPRRDINMVLADHDERLLAIPGVVGVYVGVLENEKTPCLKVMLARKLSDATAIPREIEGHPVVTEVTGEIRPLQPTP